MSPLFLMAVGAILIAVCFWLLRKRPEVPQEEVPRRTVACKKCAAPIGIKNTKLDQEFSLKCSGCGSRTIYSIGDIGTSR